MRKYENKDLSPIQFEKYQFDQDFDPAYGLEGLIASSVLDWELRQIFLAALFFIRPSTFTGFVITTRAFFLVWTAAETNCIRG